jgi:hypothetical protein
MMARSLTTALRGRPGTTGTDVPTGVWRGKTPRLAWTVALLVCASHSASARFDDPNSRSSPPNDDREDAAPIVARGRWVLMPNGQPAPYDDFQRGLQTSGLAWDGHLLWSVGDQRASFPGSLYAIDPKSGRLVQQPTPIRADDPQIRSRLEAWSRLDLEDLAILSASERRFVAVLEDKATAALVLQVNEDATTALATAVWEFQFPGDDVPVPYRNDPNYRLEGIALDTADSRGYVAFERDAGGLPRLYQFDLRSTATTGITAVPLQPLAFEGWSKLRGKPRTLLNANGLHLIRTRSGEPRLLVLCRDREMFFAIDPRSLELVGQVECQLLSPEGERIEWVSPEGIAVDSDRGVVYIITDPDSTDGNYRLRSTATAAGRFAEFVPLLFEVKLPTAFVR